MDEIIATIQQCCLEIHDQMRTSLPTDTSTTTNSSGDQQKPLDLVTDQIITERLSHNKLVAGLLSEEQPDYRSVHTDGSYIISFDPLDGSGNSPLNLSTGSIFGIFQTSTLSTLSGQNLVGAVYAIYGSSLEIIVVTDSIQSRTVYLNTPSGREPKVLTDQITIPSNSKIFVANTGNLIDGSHTYSSMLGAYQDVVYDGWPALSQMSIDSCLPGEYICILRTTNSHTEN